MALSLYRHFRIVILFSHPYRKIPGDIQGAFTQKIGGNYRGKAECPEPVPMHPPEHSNKRSVQVHRVHLRRHPQDQSPARTAESSTRTTTLFRKKRVLFPVPSHPARLNVSIAIVEGVPSFRKTSWISFSETRMPSANPSGNSTVSTVFPSHPRTPANCLVVVVPFTT